MLERAEQLQLGNKFALQAFILHFNDLNGHLGWQIVLIGALAARVLRVGPVVQTLVH